MPIFGRLNNHAAGAFARPSRIVLKRLSANRALGYFLLLLVVTKSQALLIDLMTRFRHSPGNGSRLN
jgi:hypothetical protein